MRCVAIRLLTGVDGKPEYLYRRLAPGGVLITDDYGTWQCARDATDEFLATTWEPLLLRGQAQVGRVPW